MYLAVTGKVLHFAAYAWSCVTQCRDIPHPLVLQARDLRQPAWGWLFMLLYHCISFYKIYPSLLSWIKLWTTATQTFTILVEIMGILVENKEASSLKQQFEVTDILLSRALHPVASVSHPSQGSQYPKQGKLFWHIRQKISQGPLLSLVIITDYITTVCYYFITFWGNAS